MATTNLPAIPHPLSRMEDPTNLNVRGLSRDGSRVASRQSLTFAQDFDRGKLNALRPITADQVPWRLTRSSNGFGGQHSPRNNGFAGIPEGVEVKRAEDPNKPSIPIFGKSSILCLVDLVTVVSEICDAFILYFITRKFLEFLQEATKIVLFN